MGNKGTLEECGPPPTPGEALIELIHCPERTPMDHIKPVNRMIFVKTLIDLFVGLIFSSALKHHCHCQLSKSQTFTSSTCISWLCFR